jgi:hypothetical protein
MPDASAALSCQPDIPRQANIGRAHGFSRYRREYKTVEDRSLACPIAQMAEEWESNSRFLVIPLKAAE